MAATAGGTPAQTGGNDGTRLAQCVPRQFPRTSVLSAQYSSLSASVLRPSSSDLHLCDKRSSRKVGTVCTSLQIHGHQQQLPPDQGSRQNPPCLLSARTTHQPHLPPPPRQHRCPPDRCCSRHLQTSAGHQQLSVRHGRGAPAKRTAWLRGISSWVAESLFRPNQDLKPPKHPSHAPLPSNCCACTCPRQNAHPHTPSIPPLLFMPSSPGSAQSSGTIPHLLFVPSSPGPAQSSGTSA